MLTKAEYAKHFSGHLETLILRKSGNFVVISSKDGFVCPHLTSQGCGIYLERPIDCRLFPYTMSNIFEKRKNISIVFHSRADCSQIKSLLGPEDEARRLIMEFARSVFGSARPIGIHYEKRKTLLSILRKFIDRRLSRRYNNAGH